MTPSNRTAARFQLPGLRGGLTEQQHRVPELVPEVVRRAAWPCRRTPGPRGPPRHRLEQVEVAGLGLVQSGEQPAHDPRRTRGREHQRRPALVRRHARPRGAAVSMARATVVPTATTRPPEARVSLTSRAVDPGPRSTPAAAARAPPGSPPRCAAPAAPPRRPRTSGRPAPRATAAGRRSASRRCRARLRTRSAGRRSATRRAGRNSGSAARASQVVDPVHRRQRRRPPQPGLAHRVGASIRSRSRRATEAPCPARAAGVVAVRPAQLHHPGAVVELGGDVQPP